MATDTQKDTKKLFKMIEGIEFAMLVTETSNGTLRSRPMSVKTTDSDDCLWFLTNDESGKVLEIESNRQVNVSFARPSDHTFISVSGIAQITDDRDKVDEVWTADAGLWFKDGKNDPNLTLIRVEPSQAEYWCPKSNQVVSLFEMAKSAIDRSEPDLSENETIYI